MTPNDPDLPRHRRVWSAYNRPYSGCGCLWTIIIILFIWWVLTWVFGAHMGLRPASSQWSLPLKREPLHART